MQRTTRYKTQPTQRHSTLPQHLSTPAAILIETSVLRGIIFCL